MSNIWKTLAKKACKECSCTNRKHEDMGTQEIARYFDPVLPESPQSLNLAGGKRGICLYWINMP